ncbi:MAG: hypothetical protein ACRDIC_09330 [bacterium]
MFNSLLDGTKSAIEMAAVAHACVRAGTVEVVSSLVRGI